MANRKKGNVSTPQPSPRAPEPSYWKIVAIMAIVFSVGLVVKIVFFPPQATVVNPGVPASYQTQSQGSDALDSQIRLVAANFRCACGGCGELPLIDCTCDMPQGAVEEKAFIRDKLQKGLAVEQVIPLVEKKYGHRIT
jgi:cytochrome c-type biogenesis protein CcmH/NrfF